jgi:hypothetical protein
MKIKTSLALLFFFLTACAPALTPTPTETLVPTVVPPTFTPTVNTIYPAPTLYPTQHPPPILTPDAFQVERWKEYQTELAKALFVYDPNFPQLHYGPAVSKDAICEWDILGRSGQEVYVWAMCSAPHAVDRRPAVIHLKLDGTIQKVEVPFHDSTWESTIQKLFPTDVQKKIDEYFYPMYSGRAEELRIHLLYRRTHPDVPPLIILSAMPTATITP